MQYSQTLAVLIAAITVVRSDYIGDAYGDGLPQYPQYQYGYAVASPQTGDFKTQQEARDGQLVRGSYSVNQPDGTTRLVEYAAGPYSGFNAVVRNIGQSIHPLTLGGFGGGIQGGFGGQSGFGGQGIYGGQGRFGGQGGFGGGIGGGLGGVSSQQLHLGPGAFSGGLGGIQQQFLGGGMGGIGQSGFGRFQSGFGQQGGFGGQSGRGYGY